VTTIAECTVPEKILLAAFGLEEAGQSPFSAEALIVGAWQKYPRTFGLKGYDDKYPDSNKVLASIMGEKGLARRGWLAKMGQKLYSLTRDGRQVVRRLLHADEDATPPAPVKATREQERLLNALFASTAWQKYQEGREQDLNFADACRFWGITDNHSGDALDGRLEQVGAALAQFEREVGLGSATLSNGRSVSAAEAADLGDFNTHLRDRFARHLMLLRKRVAKP
jgi:hypothetical protein